MGAPSLRTGRQVSPVVTDSEVVFRFPDPDKELAGVDLLQELQRPRHGPALRFVAAEGAWMLRWPRPRADRFEYQFELRHPGGDGEIVCDPNNPLRAPGPFGEKSAVELPSYRAPDWTSRESQRSGDIVPTTIRSRILRVELDAAIYSAPGLSANDEAPLLVVHDGPEFAAYSSLTRYFDFILDEGLVPPFRAALVAPVERDQIYSASAVYSRALAHDVLPRLAEIAPTAHGRTARVGMGASLGALAMLYVHRRSPAAFGGLFLQSGSFFRQRFDKQESHFVRFRRITRFVGQVLNAQSWVHPIPIAMTCGTVEENLVNNRALAAALDNQGYDISFATARDAHNWISWRDSLHPYLAELLKALWS